MLFLRLPGYASKLACGSLTRAAAALHIVAPNMCVDAASGGCDTQQLLQLSQFNAPLLISYSAHSAAPCAAAVGSVGHHSRGFATIASPDAAAPDIFDRELKRVHRDRAARSQAPDDPLLEAIAEGLVDRLADCKRAFPTAAVISGAGENVLRRLAGGRSGTQEVLLLDTSREMLQRARQLQEEQRAADPGGPMPQVQYIQADEECLPLNDGSVDVVICPLGLHWINDLPGALTQCRRALKPDGLFLGALLGGESLQELRIACALAEQELENGVSPRISPLAQVRDAGNLLTRAGLTIPAVDVDEIIMRYTDPMRLVRHLRAMGEQNAVRRARPSVRRDTAALTTAKYRELFGEPDDSIPATFQVIYLTGWAPHSSQQRAARRGSASASFQDLEKEVRKLEGREQPQDGLTKG